MAKETKKTGFRVEVLPCSPWLVSGGELYYIEQCERIRKAILRHIDDIDSASVVYETKSYCSFCGDEWTEASDTYNGGCCDEDEAQTAAA
jgi:hypothetical protein